MTDFKYKVGDRVRITQEFREKHPEEKSLENPGTVVGIYYKEPDPSRLSTQWPYTVLLDGDDDAESLFAEHELEAAE